MSLEDLYSGTTKHLKVGRRLLNGGTEDKVLEIQIHPGWKSGTKIRFPRAGNEQPNGEAQDLVFVVEEKPHDRFVRDGNDLVTTVKIPLVDALTEPILTSFSISTNSTKGVQISKPNRRRTSHQRRSEKAARTYRDPSDETPE